MRRPLCERDEQVLRQIIDHGPIASEAIKKRLGLVRCPLANVQTLMREGLVAVEPEFQEGYVATTKGRDYAG